MKNNNNPISLPADLDPEQKRLIKEILALPKRDLAFVDKTIQAVHGMKENKFPFMGNFMQLKPIESEFDFSCEMPITRDCLNPYRIVYGGVTAMMADMAMAWMLNDMVAARDKVVTLSMNVNYHNPGRGKLLLAHCKLTHKAQNMIQTACDIVNDRKELIASATGIFLHLSRPKKETD